MGEKNQTSVEKEEKKVASVPTETKVKLEEVKKAVEENLASAVEKELVKPKKDSKEKVPTIEKEYIVPLRAGWMKAVRYKKTNKAVRTLKEFLARHMKIYDRDLNKIKLDIHLNEFLWSRGIKNPPARVSVKAIKEGDIVRVELLSPSEHLKFKKNRLNKRAEKAVSSAKKKPMKEEAGKSADKGIKAEPSEGDKKEAKEKKTAIVEAGVKQAKAEAQIAKHTTKGKSNQPKHQKRMALQK